MEKKQLYSGKQFSDALLRRGLSPACFARSGLWGKSPRYVPRHREGRSLKKEREVPNFKMSWHDFINHQFVYNGKTYSLCKARWVGNGKPVIKHRILFLLNIHRDRFVSRDDLIEFTWGEQDPDKWGDDQDGVMSVLVCNIRKVLPVGVSIKRQRGFGYKLEIGEGNEA